MNERQSGSSRTPIDIEYTVEQAGQRDSYQPPQPKKSSPRLNIILFIATLFTTTLVGALTSANPSMPFWPQFYKGLPFSITLLTILLFHEFGHYFMARKHNIDATLPYFIPAPPFFIVGTLGAFIKMRSPLRSKKALFDVGAAGPLAGIIVAIPAVIIGLRLSEVKAFTEFQGYSLGSSLLFSLLTNIVVGKIPALHDVVLHPVAFAGWVGFLVTMLNLLPVGQLDGGHIVYAMLGRRRHQQIASTILPLLLCLGSLPIPYLLLHYGILPRIAPNEYLFVLRDWLKWLAGYGWLGWILWYFLLRFLIKPSHPPTLDETIALDKPRIILGWVAFAVFILTFIPSPIIMTSIF